MPGERLTFSDFPDEPGNRMGLPLAEGTWRCATISDSQGPAAWDGISVYRTSEQAARIATLSPRHGTFIAEIKVPLDGSFRLELDNGDNGHSTIWGDANDLLGLVVSVTLVQGLH